MGGTLAVLLIAFHRSAVSLVHHGANMLERFAALPLERKGYILGGRSDAATHGAGLRALVQRG